MGETHFQKARAEMPPDLTCRTRKYQLEGDAYVDQYGDKVHLRLNGQIEIEVAHQLIYLQDFRAMATSAGVIDSMWKEAWRRHD